MMHTFGFLVTTTNYSKEIWYRNLNLFVQNFRQEYPINKSSELEKRAFSGRILKNLKTIMFFD